MAKISENVNDKDLADHIQESLSNIVITTKPVVIVGVQRKANIGNYENIDIYAALALPVDIPLQATQDQIQLAIAEATNYGFSFVSQATAERYNSVVKKREE